MTFKVIDHCLMISNLNDRNLLFGTLPRPPTERRAVNESARDGPHVEIRLIGE